MVRIENPENYELDEMLIANNAKHKYIAVMKNKRTGKLRKVYFGDVNYQHYHDKLGHYSNLDHFDKERRRRFLKRTAKNASHKFSSAWWSALILW